MHIDWHDLWDDFWRDRHGRVVIWQTPNGLLIAWVVLTILSLLISGRPADVLSWAASAALIAWALLELFKGVNYLRRLLGLIVLIFSIMSLLHNL